MQIRAIAFDIDGTLYPNRRMYLHSLPSFLFHPMLVLRFGRVRKEIRKKAFDGGFRQAQARFLSRASGGRLSETKAAEKIDRHLYGVWERSFRGVRPFAQLRETLLSFKRSGVKLAVLSDFPIQRKLSYLGVDDLIDIACCSEDSGRLKPDPLPFRRLVSALGLPPEEILYVGNSYRYDIEGAAGVGMRTAYLTRSREQKGIADFAFFRYPELRRWVEERLN
ncbi:HAD family hydrolase [Sediminispirochaeta smaragdinae]|uniref:Haloacid dehalogenase domain protein hydrolase n=1 Tax=Sediminispirochaeta smaragdinae (strain DSM 11293 / JCM 15392 / SEBR 4228) TaxID=573413 RepID=E1R5H1_SEDSS|nr:HAD family hydrolase [Sediminispirochaeta smaragdinae]ADK82299.1 Haloacid dehalogenase domain protein hydrolase [Sediminispirochaeta smaragdinae DSM 11293]